MGAWRLFTHQLNYSPPHAAAMLSGMAYHTVMRLGLTPGCLEYAALNN